MNHLHRQIATLAVLTLFILSTLSAFYLTTTSEVTSERPRVAIPKSTLSQSQVNLSIPYVDEHYGYADGIIDPYEYSYNYTDPVTGITVFMEHNSTVLFVGLKAPTSGWVAIGWKSPNGTYTSDGINGSDIIYGAAPGTPHTSYPRINLQSTGIIVHYKLYMRNGTLLQEGDAPSGDDETTLEKENLLSAYKQAILGMRIGEVRHFIIPAEKGYTSESDTLYGEDLEYVVTVTKIGATTTNPADSSQIQYIDAHGVGTVQYVADDDQSRVLQANATDDGSITQLEYFIQMNSTDPNDIPLLNSSEMTYPFILMYSPDENFDSFPAAHSDWSNPMAVRFVPNQEPVLDVLSPISDGVLEWITHIELNVTDDTLVRRAGFRIDNESWVDLKFDFKTDLWTFTLDASVYESGSVHTVWLNATDASNVTVVISRNVTVHIPYNPLLGMSLTVSRTITTLMYHGVKSTDEIKVKNENALPISAIEVYLPESYRNNFLSIEAQDSSENPLDVLKLPDEGGMYRWRVYFASPIEAGGSYKFTVVMYFHSVQEIYNYDDNIYSLRFYKYPMLPYVIDRLSISMAFRSGDSFYNGTNPEGVYYNVNPFTYEEFTLLMKSFTPDIVAIRKTEIRIDPWGWLHYKETITLDNVGPARETDIAYTFPAYMSNVRIYDRLGILASSQPSDYNWNETLKQRINLKKDRFGDEGFMPNYHYTFYVEYDLYLPQYQKSVADGNKIEFPMSTIDEILVKTHTVDVVVPMSVNVIQASGEYRLLYGGFDAILRYTAYNTTQRNPIEISLVYQMTPAILARPLLFALIIGLVAALYVSVRKVELPVEGEMLPEEEAAVVRQAGAPPELLSEFAKAYSKKTALNLDLEKLESARKRGKVSKREFMVRERDIKAQLEKIDAQLASLKEELISYGSRYRDVIGQLELQEERIEGAKAGLRQLLLRKKKQKISRAAFEKTRQEYLKTIKQAVTATDRILLSLQEEAGEV
ncbi:MAG: FKBP-type peptidyl-prolyl cis-trans isomerase [Candidatus Thorarchaeota archaeon]